MEGVDEGDSGFELYSSSSQWGTRAELTADSRFHFHTGKEVRWEFMDVSEHAKGVRET